ncbi:MAG: hypothetical protein ACJAVT_001864 [Yoonia sp.]
MTFNALLSTLFVGSNPKVARQLGQAAARLCDVLVTARSPEALLAQAKGIKATARSVGSVNAHGAAVGQTVHTGIVTLKTALAKQALRAKTGFNAAQAFAWQITITRLVVPAMAVQISPAIVAAIGSVLHGFRTLCCAIIALVALYSGVQGGNGSYTNEHLSNIFAVKSIRLRRCSGSKSQ